MNAENHKGRRHSSFERAINYCFLVDGEERLITILKEGIPLLPDSIIVSLELFTLIKENADDIVKIKDNHFCVGNITIPLDSNDSAKLFLPDILRGEHCTIVWKHVQLLNEYIQKQNKKSDLLRLPVRFVEGVNQFADSLLNEDRVNAEREFDKLIGAGKGLTPACDDAIVGVLAVMCLYYSQNANYGFWQYEYLVAGILEKLKTRKITTVISTKYLKNICRGSISVPIEQLLKWLFMDEDQFPINEIEQILRTGHTSGVDTLFGIQCALKCIECGENNATAIIRKRLNEN